MARISAIMISDRTYELCRDPRNVTSELAKNPTEAPVDVAKRLYGSHPEQGADKANEKADIDANVDLDRTFECGKWGPTRPSELFLRVSARIVARQQELTIHRSSTMSYKSTTRTR